MSRSASTFFALVCALIVACGVAPDAQAASSGGKTDSTRDQVRQDLAQYRCAGYNPIADEIDYPNDVDAARDRLQSSGCQDAGAVASPSKHGKGQSK